MASFKSPYDGVQAAIAMQQRLERQRNEDRHFDIQIRIGVHTGAAIVEENDVYGDMVNISARVESAAKGNEILVSQSTARRLQGRKSKYGLKHKKKFVPKGKSRALTVWFCDWQKYPNLLSRVRTHVLIPPNKRQKRELILFLVVGVLAAYLLFYDFLRFFLADIELIALYVINPHPAVKWGLLAALGVVLFFSIRSLLLLTGAPLRLFMIIKGGFGFGVIFIVTHFLFEWIDVDWGKYWNGILYRSNNAFVETIADNVSIHGRPTKKSRVIATVKKGSLFLFRGNVKKGKFKWSRVRVRQGKRLHGFILEREPPKLGIPPKKLIERKKLSLRYHHAYAFLLALCCFFWGYFSFRLRPL